MTQRDPSSRRAFLGRSALAGGALALGVTLPALPARALDLSYGDARSLAFLLEVQKLQAEFFTRAALTSAADGLTLGESNTLNTLSMQDGQQKRWVKMALRRFAMSPGAMPNTMSGGMNTRRFSFGPMTSRDMIMREALRLKTLGVAAWTGAAGDMEKGEISSAVASLAGVQARHRAMLADALGEPVLLAMAPARSMRQVTRDLERYGFSTEAF